MKILHTGDIHLDSSFSSSDILSSQAKREEQRKLICRIFDTAKRECCDMILIAGDLFDGKYVTPETAQLLLHLFSEAECPVIIAPGNHDPFVEGSFYKSSDIPENVFIFSSSALQCFEFERLRVKVYGYAFCSGVMNSSPLVGIEKPEKDGCFNILCAHADIYSPLSRYCPMTVGDIASFGIDYAALGHIHNVALPENVKGSVIGYCGIPQGRSYDELGEGGVIIVTLDHEKPVTVEKRIVSEIRFEIAELDLSKCSDVSDIRNKIRETVEKYSVVSGTNLRLCLVGNAEKELLSEALQDIEPLRASLASFELRDLTLPYSDTRALEKDVGLKGEFYRSLYPYLISDKPTVRAQAARALQIGLAAIDGRSVPSEEGEVRE